MGDYSWIGPVIQAGSQLIGSQQAIGGANQQNQLLKDAYQRALALLQGGQLNWTPERVGPIGPSAMAGVQADPAAVMAQQEALARLGAASKSGFDEIDRAAINRTMNEAAMQEKGSREAALARLDPNSGAATAARMQAAQSGANRANQQGLDIAAMSRKRALDALGAYGGLAGKMRGQSFDEGATRAGAADSISKFNAELSRWNAGQANTAKQSGVANTLAALGLAGGAGGALGAGLANSGKLQAQQTAGIGKGLSGALNAANENNKDSTTSSPTSYDELTPEEEENLNRDDD